MSMMVGIEGQFPDLYGFPASHPYLTVAILIISLCFVTRIVSGLRACGQDFSSPTKRVKVTPYWIPFIGSTLQFAQESYGYILKLSKKANDGVVAINMGGSIHHFLLSPSLAKSFFAQRSLNMNEFVYTFLENFQGDSGYLRALPEDVLWGSVHKTLFTMMREEFLTTSMNRVLSELKQRTPQMISFAKSEIDQHVWEKTTRIQVESDDAAVVDLWSLSRNFVGDLASLVLMGSDFMNNSPDLLRDLWTHDAKFNGFLLGLPRIVPTMWPAYAARDRLKRAVERWSLALHDFQTGKDPGFAWGNMSDVSDVMKVRNQAWFDNRTPRESLGPGDLSILWALNVNANAVIFFALYHIISDPSLYSRVMSEISPYAHFASGENDLPFPDLPNLNISGSDIIHHCPLLKATYYETLRVDAHPYSYRRAVSDTILTESPEDAALLGKTVPQSYLIPKDSYVAIPHGAIQMDPKYWDAPHEFRPERFLTTVRDEKSGESKTRVDMGLLMSYGGGPTMCKGRRFAEMEILAFLAAILACWDFEPVDSKKGWPKVKKFSTPGADQTKAYFVRMRRRTPVKMDGC